MEITVVVLLTGIFSSALLGILINSNTYWNHGQNKITEQEAARVAMGTIVRDLRESNTYWGVNITAGQIDFYKPVFNSTGYLTSNYFVRFRPKPGDAHILQKCDNEGGPVVCRDITGYIESLSFLGSTDGCQTFDNYTVPTDCPRIRVILVTKQEKNFTLTSDVVLRNQFTAALGVPPEEGEF